MRSIGKINIKKLKLKVREVVEEEKNNLFGLDIQWQFIPDKVKERLPVEWFDLWESAWSEIDRVIDDEICQILYHKDGR